MHTQQKLEKKNERRNCAIKYRNRYTRCTHIESIRLVQRRCCGIRVDAVKMVDLNSSFPAKMWVRLSLREVRRQTSDQTKFLPLQLSFPIIQHRCFNGWPEQTVPQVYTRSCVTKPPCWPKKKMRTTTSEEKKKNWRKQQEKSDFKNERGRNVGDRIALNEPGERIKFSWQDIYLHFVPGALVCNIALWHRPHISGWICLCVRVCGWAYFVGYCMIFRLAYQTYFPTNCISS